MVMPAWKFLAGTAPVVLSRTQVLSGSASQSKGAPADCARAKPVHTDSTIARTRARNDAGREPAVDPGYRADVGPLSRASLPRVMRLLHGALRTRRWRQPWYSSTCRPAFQSLTYMRPSVAT